MAHSRTAKKNIRKNEKRRALNRTQNATMRTEIKRVRAAIASGDIEEAKAGFSLAQKMLDKAAKTNRMHRNTAARSKSRLAKEIAAAVAS
jgi:small subunit ribosomal protein S20